jgi:hypothetical protein
MFHYYFVVLESDKHEEGIVSNSLPVLVKIKVDHLSAHYPKCELL